VSGFYEGVMSVRVSRNPISRHPLILPRAVFNKTGRGVVIQSKTKSHVIEQILIIYKDLYKDLKRGKEKKKRV